MFHRFRDRFGTAGIVIAVIALVAALGGTALAAGALTGKQKKEVEKIAKKFAGKPGAAGTNGNNGKDGTNGIDGSPGNDGARGIDGTSATATAFTGSKGTCNNGQGGLEVKSASATSYVCNGEAGEAGESPFGASFAGNAEPAGNPCKGAGGTTYTVEGVDSILCNGTEGSPWSAGGTLPPGSTETGAWATMRGAGTEVPTPVSFSIQLAQGLTSAHTHVSGQAGFASACLGNVDHPSAAPGELCIYKGEAVGASNPQVWQTGGGSEGASVGGAILYWDLAADGFATGSYAVTGCSAAVGAQVPCP